MANEETQQKKSGCGKYFAIGCVSVIVLAVIVGVVAFFGIKKVVSGLAEEYTATQPAVLPVVQVSDQEAQVVLQRVGAFATALKENKPASELRLTSQDINVLIHNHPNWTNMAGKVYVKIEGDKIHGEASIPLSEVGSMFKGRYLNGSAVFRVEMTAGRLLVFLDSLTVKGKALPDEFMKSMRAKNLAEEQNQNPEVVSFLQKLESITVRDGTIRIVPK